MKRIQIRWMLLVMVLTLFIYDGKAETVNRSKYDAGGVPTIHPKGWLQTMLQRQHDGQAVAVSKPTIAKVDGSIPFDDECTPVRLRIPVKEIDWTLDDNRYTPHLPEQGKLKLLSPERQYIELVPYGCTELRLTVFPDADAPKSQTSNLNAPKEYT